MQIGNKTIGPGHPAFIIAEIGINHNGSMETIKAHVDAAAGAGADAVKFQMFAANRLYVPNAGTYKMMGKTMDIIDVVKEGEFKEEWMPELKNYVESKGLVFFASVFSFEDVDYLEKFKPDLYKLASYELTNLPLFEHTAKTGKPILFSVGGGNMSEIDEAARTLVRAGNKDFIILQCIAEYPAPREDSNLATIPALSAAFGVPVGLSDHSFEPDIMEVPLAAVALGACVIEKHFTLSRSLPGPDHKFAIEPAELKTLVERIRAVEAKRAQGEAVDVDPVLLGSSARMTLPKEQYVRDFAYKYLFTKKPIAKGEVFTIDNITILRPGELKRGIEPKYYPLLLDKKVRASRDMQAFEPITWETVLTI